MLICSGKFGVRVWATQTVLLPDFVMSLPHLGPPLFLLGLHLVRLSRHLGFKPLGPKVLAFAAAEHADDQTDDDDASHHRHGDDQGLEVHPAEPPARVIERTHRVRRQDGLHRVRDAGLARDAPEARHISEAFFAVCSILGLTRLSEGSG